MNSFVISVGGYVKPLLKAGEGGRAKKIGEVRVDMGDTACKVPLATDVHREDRKDGPRRQETQDDEVLNLSSLSLSGESMG